MIQNTETSRCLVLRLKIFEGNLTRNIAKFGSMNPYIEALWNEDKWKSKVVSAGHLNPVWNEGYVFEALDPAPLHLKVVHSGLFFTHHEVGTAVISSEELTQGKTKEWVELFYEGTNSGKILLSVNMYEERRSEQSTHTTSYAAVNLKEEYSRKLNELELEKEELEFYKRKYKRKLEKLNQEKRNYRAKVSEIVRRTTPKHTEETSSDEIADSTQPVVTIIGADDYLVEDLGSIREKALASREREAYVQLKDEVEGDLAKLRREKQKISLQRKVVGHSQGKLSDITRSMDIMRQPIIKKSVSEDKVSKAELKFVGDWSEVEAIKKQLIKEKDPENNEELLELKLEMGNRTASPRKATTPKSTDLSRANACFRGSHNSTGKFVLYY